MRMGVVGRPRGRAFRGCKACSASSSKQIHARSPSLPHTFVQVSVRQAVIAASPSLRLAPRWKGPVG